MLTSKHCTVHGTAVLERLNDIPDEFVLIGVIEGHEHFGVLADLAHHVLQRHKQRKRWRGGKFGLTTQIQILSLRLGGRGGEKEGDALNSIILIGGAFTLGLIQDPEKITELHKRTVNKVNNPYTCTCKNAKCQVQGFTLLFFCPLVQSQHSSANHNNSSFPSPNLKQEVKWRAEPITLRLRFEGLVPQTNYNY